MAENHFDKLDVSAEVSIETGAELQLQINGVEPRVSSKFIGMVQGEYLIIKTPTLSELGGLEVKLYTGNQVIVRYIHQGSVYGFETSIIDSISSPFRLLFLRSPTVIIDRNIRSNKRINTALPGRVQSDEGSLEGTVTDISITGCHFVSKRGQKATKDLKTVGGEVSVFLQLPGVEGELSLTGALRNVRETDAGLHIGIAFRELDENAQLSIDEYVKISD